MGFFSKGHIFDTTKKDTGSHTFQIKGKSVNCPHCGNTQFFQKQILLNTPGMTFFSLDWANKTASALICTKCSQILWFNTEPEIILEV